MKGEILCVMSPRLVRLTRMTMDGNGKKVLLFILKIRGKAIEMKKIIYLFGWICVCGKRKPQAAIGRRKQKNGVGNWEGIFCSVLDGIGRHKKQQKMGKRRKHIFGQWTWWKELCVYFCCVCSIFG